jgi:hypothetical protein
MKQEFGGFLSLLMSLLLFALCNPCTVFFRLKKRELDLFWRKWIQKKGGKLMYSSVVCFFHFAIEFLCFFLYLNLG